LNDTFSSNVGNWADGKMPQSDIERERGISMRALCSLWELCYVELETNESTRKRL